MAGITITHKFISALLVITFLAASGASAPALTGQLMVTAESWTEQARLDGAPGRPVVISPLARIELSDRTQKVIVVPEKLEIKDEIQEFRMFRNRYVIFGVYLSLALYYNWLTRHR